jgi:hypothetical protein
MLLTTFNVMLGLFNAWMLLRSRRVTLKVVPYVPLGPAVADDRDTFQTRITVTNLSQFPVYVTEVGFTFRERDGGDMKLHAAGHQFPMVVEARETIKVTADPRELLADFARYPIKCAYAKTACGRTRTGISPSLLDYELVKAEGNGGATRWLRAARVRAQVLAWLDRHVF